MRSKSWIFLWLCVMVAGAAAPALAQDAVRKQLFSEADELKAKAKELRAEFYAPTSYKKAMSYYNDAMEEYSDGKSLEDIREDVKNAELYFAKALDASKKGEETFRSTTNARNDALTAGAVKSSLKLYNDAEEKFIRATFKLEDGNESSAFEAAREAETLYRTAELEAIKANFLTPARDLLKLADDLDVKDNAPLTMSKSQRLVHQVESLLRGNRYDTDSARDLARLARYEAAHAIYLHKLITNLKKTDKTYEEVMLESETQFQRVAGALGIRARFDSGFGGPVNEMNAAIKRFDQRLLKDADTLHQLASMIGQKDNEIDNLRQQVNAMQARLGSLNG